MLSLSALVLSTIREVVSSVMWDFLGIKQKGRVLKVVLNADMHLVVVVGVGIDATDRSIEMNCGKRVMRNGNVFVAVIYI